MPARTGPQCEECPPAGDYPCSRSVGTRTFLRDSNRPPTGGFHGVSVSVKGRNSSTAPFSVCVHASCSASFIVVLSI